MYKLKEKYVHSGGSSKGAFSKRACKNTTHPSLAFHHHVRLERHIRLEEK